MDKEDKLVVMVVVACFLVILGILYGIHLESEMIVDLIKNGTPPAEARVAIKG